MVLPILHVIPIHPSLFANAFNSLFGKVFSWKANNELLLLPWLELSHIFSYGVQFNERIGNLSSSIINHITPLPLTLQEFGNWGKSIIHNKLKWRKMHFSIQWHWLFFWKNCSKMFDTVPCIDVQLKGICVHPLPPNWYPPKLFLCHMMFVLNRALNAFFDVISHYNVLCYGEILIYSCIYIYICLILYLMFTCTCYVNKGSCLSCSSVSETAHI